MNPSRSRLIMGTYEAVLGLAEIKFLSVENVIASMTMEFQPPELVMLVSTHVDSV